MLPEEIKEHILTLKQRQKMHDVINRPLKQTLIEKSNSAAMC